MDASYRIAMTKQTMGGAGAEQVIDLRSGVPHKQSPPQQKAKPISYSGKDSQ